MKRLVKKVSNDKRIRVGLIVCMIAILVGVIAFVYVMINNNTCNGEIDDPILEYPEVDKKPVIYLYPETTMELSIKLGKPENITCSYPEYKNGWNVIANPNGLLIDKSTGRKLYSLYWEGIHTELIDTNEGFVVKRENLVEFLEEKLELLGLNELEMEEFIIYWLPILQENEYSFIRFATMDEINKNMPLEFSTTPDTIIRVLMEYKKVDSNYKVTEQKLETPNRVGFVAVEWGGTKIN